MNTHWKCPVCDADSSLLDVVDFNKSCEEARGSFLGLSGFPIYYAMCGGCDFCFAPEICRWDAEEFRKKIYNDKYIDVDPDYAENRPRANARYLHSAFPVLPPGFRHLDYASGNGLLTSLLREYGWASMAYAYSPSTKTAADPDRLGQFDLITAFEVFEHVPDVQVLMRSLRRMLTPGGILLLSTLLSDGHIHRNRRLDWWYASPRNGHVSLFSAKSLKILAGSSGFELASLSPGLHMLFTSLPDWASHCLGERK